MEIPVSPPNKELVGGWTNPLEKYARQIGSFPEVGMKIKNIWNHQLGTHCLFNSSLPKTTAAHH